MTALLNLAPILLAILCYILSGVFKTDQSTHDGLTALAGLLAGMAIPRLGDMFRRSQVEEPTAKEAEVVPIRKPDRGSVSLGVLVALLVFLFATIGIVYASHAADPMPCPQLSVCSGPWAAQPAAAVGWVANLKTGEVASATALLGVSIVHRGGIALGGGLYGGSVLSPSGARPTLAALFSVANFGAIGPGVVMFKDGERVVYQMTLDVSLNLNFGGSPSYVQAAKAAP
jgi:hypothetical protein